MFLFPAPRARSARSGPPRGARCGGSARLSSRITQEHACKRGLGWEGNKKWSVGREAEKLCQLGAGWRRAGEDGVCERDRDRETETETERERQSERDRIGVRETEREK